MRGTDQLYRDALLAADKWHKEALDNLEDANFWYLKSVWEANMISHLLGLAIFEGLVILGLLISIIFYG